jgi:hypothetical protein
MIKGLFPWWMLHMRLSREKAFFVFFGDLEVMRSRREELEDWGRGIRLWKCIFVWDAGFILGMRACQRLGNRLQLFPWNKWIFRYYQ